MHWLLIVLGPGLIWIARRQSDDIPAIAALAAGLLLLLGGFVTLPTASQIGLELCGVAVVMLPLPLLARLLP